MIGTPIEVFRIIAAEFSDVDDGVVLDWLTLSEPLVSKRRYGTLYNQALALLTAHRMKLAGVGVEEGEDPLFDVSKIGTGGLMRVNSFSEGEASIGFNTDTSRYTSADAELALTAYGIQYLSLRRMRILPIVSSGESYGGT